MPNVPKTRIHRKLRVPRPAKPDDPIHDPQITEEAYQLLAQGAPQKDLLTVVTAPTMAEYAARPALPTFRFKLRGRLKDQIPELDAFIAAGLAAGMTPMQLMAEVLPPPSAAEDARRAGIRERNERMNAKRLARQAALDDPEKRERERVSYQKKIRLRARRPLHDRPRALCRALERQAADGRALQQRRQQVQDARHASDWRRPQRSLFKPRARLHCQSGEGAQVRRAVRRRLGCPRHDG